MYTLNYILDKQSYWLLWHISWTLQGTFITKVRQSNFCFINLQQHFTLLANPVLPVNSITGHHIFLILLFCQALFFIHFTCQLSSGSALQSFCSVCFHFHGFTKYILKSTESTFPILISSPTSRLINPVTSQSSTLGCPLEAPQIIPFATLNSLSSLLNLPFQQQCLSR